VVELERLILASGLTGAFGGLELDKRIQRVARRHPAEPFQGLGRLSDFQVGVSQRETDLVPVQPGPAADQAVGGQEQRDAGGEVSGVVGLFRLVVAFGPAALAFGLGYEALRKGVSGTEQHSGEE